MLSVSAVIPTYRRPDKLAQCLRALFNQELPGSDFEVVVVDDGSGDETRRVVSDLEAQATFPVRYEFQANRGPAAARNRGARLAAGDLLLFLGDDTIAAPSLVVTHVRAHATAQGDVAILGPEVRDSRTRTPFARFMTHTTAAFLQQMQTTLGPEGELPFRYFITSNISLRREFFLTNGGFNESFRHAMVEDTELGYRLTQRGLRILYRPDALVTHRHDFTWGEQVRRAFHHGYYGSLFTGLHGRPLRFQPGSAWRETAKDFIYPPLAATVPWFERLGIRLPDRMYQRLLDYYEIRGARAARRVKAPDHGST